MVTIMHKATLLLALAVASLMLGACSKKAEPAKSAEERAAEKAANDKSVRDNAVWGTQVQALDKAKATRSAVEQQADEAAKKIEDSSK